MRILSTTLIVLVCSSSTAIGQGNDTCSLAQPIVGEGTFAFDNFAATTDGLPDPICENAGQTQMDHDVWFVWTAPSSGSVTMSTCGLTSIDSWIAAYDGSACPTGAPLDCNDDTCGTQSQVSFAATAGSDYLLRVGSWAGAAGGTGSISLSLQVPIGNDDCASAEVISGEGLFPFDNTSATVDGVGDVLCTAAAAGQIEKDVWFRWTATFTGDAHVRTCNGASHDTQLAAYDLQACPPSGALVCNDDACSVQSAITFPVMNGSEYLLRVGVWQTSPGGSGDIEISENAGPSCASLVSGPDVVVGNLTEFSNWGTVGTRAAYSIGATACNFGDQEMPWQGNTAQHPVIAQNLYRVRDERIEQVGLSWVKHGFGSATENACCICQDPNNGQILGIGCADTYGSGTNGAQSLGPIGGIGARSDVNPLTGVFPFPYPTMGMTGDNIYKRMQVELADLDPALNVGAEYFGEVHYVAPADAAAGHGDNNASYRPVAVGAPDSGTWDLSFTDFTERGLPAIYAWQAVDPNVEITIVDVPGDGRFFVAALARELGPNLWRYEYALHNLNSHRAGQSFSVPFTVGTTITNVGFKDVDQHSGEIYDSSDWSSAVFADRVDWTTSSFAMNPNANALRWATLYNFWFDADVAPENGSTAIDLFRPGAPGDPGRVNATALVPGGACQAENYCIAAPNSAGSGAVMGASGTTIVANNDFTLEVSGCPTNEFGIFFYGEAPAQIVLGDGWRCIGGSVVRLFPVQNTGATGAAGRLLDFDSLPPGESIAAGSSYYFQFWHRDPGGPGGTGINLSDGLSVTFCP
jgi:hypothetical protein